MRILHTSDWHLGRSFHGAGLLDHQAQVLEHLYDVTVSEGVDVVVVSGDIYDRALPPTDAVTLLNDTLARFAQGPAKVILTSGNHDSIHRLGFGESLIEAAGIHIRTRAASVGSPVMLGDEHGEVAFYPLPYLDPNAVVEPWGLTQRSHEAALAEAMRRVGADLGSRGSVRSVAMAHAFVINTGSAVRSPAETSDSERDISVGGVQHVPASIFDGMDYTALGHLHGRQSVTDRVRYSGSPLAYSFSEAQQRKGSWVVDLGPTGEVTADFIDAPVPRPVARLTGTLDELLTGDEHLVHEGAWVEAHITDALRPDSAMDRLRRRFPHIVSLRFTNLHRPETAAAGRQVTGLTDRQIVDGFVTHVRGEGPSVAEGLVLDEAVDACCGAGEVLR